MTTWQLPEPHADHYVADDGRVLPRLSTLLDQVSDFLPPPDIPRFALHKAADLGTNVHAAVSVALGGDPPLSLPPLSERGIERATRATASWASWYAADPVDETIVNELPLECSAGFVTTVDFAGLFLDGTHRHIDWKTSNDVQTPRYAMQLVGQRMAIDESKLLPATYSSHIVRLDKDQDNTFDVWTLEGDLDAGRTIMRGLAALYHARHPSLRRTQ